MISLTPPNNWWGGNHYCPHFTNTLRPQKKLSFAQGYTASKEWSWHSTWGKWDLKKVGLAAFKIWRVKKNLILLVWKAVFEELSLSPRRATASSYQGNKRRLSRQKVLEDGFRPDATMGKGTQMALCSRLGEGRNQEPSVCISSIQFHSGRQTSLSPLLVSERMTGMINGKTEAEHGL